jgi:hypothetical protein
MTALQTALAYVGRGWPVFPCREHKLGRKRPYTPRGFYDAATDPAVITRWWQQWPAALIGVPTGPAAGFIALDIDTKDPRANGFDTLKDLGHVLPESPMAHTPNHGLHVYFVNPTTRELRCSAGLLGPGLDIRASGGYAILPSPGSGYTWDPLLNFNEVDLADPPPWLWPAKVSRPVNGEPIAPVSGLNCYGEKAIERACDAIVRAPHGEQERTLNAQSFALGTLAGANALPPELTLRTLLRAANAMPDYDPAFPWRPEELDLKIRRAFAAGMRRPREVRYAVG